MRLCRVSLNSKCEDQQCLHVYMSQGRGLSHTAALCLFISTGTRFVCQWIMLLHYTNVLLVHNERIPLSNYITGPQLGSVERCPSQTVVQVRHAQAQVCHIQFNTYLAKISSNGQILYLNCPGMDVLMYARYSQLYMQLNSP